MALSKDSSSPFENRELNPNGTPGGLAIPFSCVSPGGDAAPQPSDRE